MPEYAWLTDVHLNFIDNHKLTALAAAINNSGAAGVLLGGDIAEAHSVGPLLKKLGDQVHGPIYFVLGNHDYYKGNIADVREAMVALTANTESLHWLPGAGLVELTSSTTLFGHGGWGDGRLGDFINSNVRLNDYVLIRELAGISHGKLLTRLGQLGDEAADHVRATLPDAVANYDHVVFLTHVPPFREACVHEGKISDDNWLPHFSCKAVGDALIEIMAHKPTCQLTVLCGHTHGFGQTDILPNLRVLTGGAEYGEPAIQQPLLLVA